MVLAHNIDEGSRTKDIQISASITFASMLLAPQTLRGLEDSGFFRPSPIQLHAIPLGKCGFDLLLEAKSGTGKTAVFSVIALEKIDLKQGLQSVILAPTREIAAQICDVIKQIGAFYEGLQVEVVMGGLPVQDDIAKFANKRVHIVVGSPGRLRQLIQEKHIKVASVRLIVFDEADKLVDKSFLNDINYIFSSLPQAKQVIMSSATYPEDSKGLINKYMTCAQHICPDTDSILLGIEQKITIVKYNSNIVNQTKYRFEELLKILSRKQFKQCLIFCNFQARVAEVGKMLKKAKWPAEQLYGLQEQTDRLEALRTLQDYGCRILVSTDLAARGIDASNVDLVINFEPPNEWQTYLHRIGRAGRYGSYGTAITILSERKEHDSFKKMIGEIRGAINLKNLWDDEIVSAGSNTQTIATLNSTTENLERTLNHNEEKLWNLFTSQTTNDCNELESFESLCKSFEQTTTTEVEAFTDLLNSMDSYDNNNSKNEDNTMYEHFNGQTVPEIKQCLSMIRNLHLSKEPETCVSNGATQGDTDRAVNEISTNVDGNRNIATVLENTMNIEEKNTVNNTDEHEEYGNDNDELTAALIQAGLPTSFGSSKHKKLNAKFCRGDGTQAKQNGIDDKPSTSSGFQQNDVPKNNYETRHEKSSSFGNKYLNINKNTSETFHSNNNYQSRGHTKLDDLKPSLKSKSEAKHKTVPYYSESDIKYYDTKKRLVSETTTVSEESYDDPVQPFYEDSISRTTQYSKATYNKLKQSSMESTATSKNNRHSSTHSSKKTYVHKRNESKESILNQRYLNWYRTLKYNTQQLELAYYIQELTKM